MPCPSLPSTPTPPAELDAHVQLTVDLINNKTDGWYDELLPGIELVVHTNDSQCDTVRGALAFTSLTSIVPNLAGIIGPTCSGSGSSIAPLAGLKRIPTISGSATATPLAEVCRGVWVWVCV